MMNKQSRILETVAALFLLCVFSGCMVAVALSGARTYQGISNVLQVQYGERTALSYLTARIRHHDTAGAVEVGELSGCPAVVLNEEIGGERYRTYIYSNDGYLCELFCSADARLSAEDGERIVPLEGLVVAREDDMLILTCGADGGEITSSVCLRAS